MKPPRVKKPRLKNQLGRVTTRHHPLRRSSTDPLPAVNSPSLSNRPSVMRSSGVVSRSAPYMILDRK